MNLFTSARARENELLGIAAESERLAAASRIAMADLSGCDFTRPGLTVASQLVWNEIERSCSPVADAMLCNLDGRMALAMIETNQQQTAGEP